MVNVCHTSSHTLPWVGLRCVIVVVPDHLTFLALIKLRGNTFYFTLFVFFSIV